MQKRCTDELWHANSWIKLDRPSQMQRRHQDCSQEMGKPGTKFVVQYDIYESGVVKVRRRKSKPCSVNSHRVPHTCDKQQDLSFSMLRTSSLLIF